MFLERIVQTKKEEVACLRKKEQELKQVSEQTPVRSLKKAFSTFGVLAEVKHASPSKGVIQEDFRPLETAEQYEQGGAKAISVLTDETYFQGSSEILTQVRQQASLPVLRKDFIIDPLQVWESKKIGADAILLIVAILTPEKLKELARLAHQLGLEVLVEIHQRQEVEAALACEADVIGINNRDLTTFETRLEVTEQLRPLLPAEQVVLAESGIHSPADAHRMRRAGVNGLLIGEYLMRQDDRVLALRELVGA
jgi:indole-3-glycerol phosphate synthase